VFELIAEYSMRILGKIALTGCQLDQMIKKGFALYNLSNLFHRNGRRLMLYCISNNGIPAFHSVGRMKWMAHFHTYKKALTIFIGFLVLSSKISPSGHIHPYILRRDTKNCASAKALANASAGLV
jgi:hypothetical protein